METPACDTVTHASWLVIRALVPAFTQLLGAEELLLTSARREAAPAPCSYLVPALRRLAQQEQRLWLGLWAQGERGGAARGTGIGACLCETC